jgi:ribosomal protein S27E
MRLNKGLIGVFRERNCEVCQTTTNQEIIFENKLLIANCLECGQEVILSKEEVDGK